MKIHEELKKIIYWVGFGILLIGYAEGRFSTVDSVNKIEARIINQADKSDIVMLSGKMDTVDNKINELMLKLIRK